MISILFVCTGNSCRSPLAEVLARREWGASSAQLRIASAGLSVTPGAAASELAQAVAMEDGLRLDDHLARHFDAELLEGSDLVLTMGAGHKAEILRRHPESKGRVFTLAEFSGLAELGDVVDPWGGDIEDYRMSLEVLRRHLKAANQNLRAYLK